MCSIGCTLINIENHRYERLVFIVFVDTKGLFSELLSPNGIVLNFDGDNIDCLVRLYENRRYFHNSSFPSTIMFSETSYAHLKSATSLLGVREWTYSTCYHHLALGPTDELLFPVAKYIMAHISNA